MLRLIFSSTIISEETKYPERIKHKAKIIPGGAEWRRILARPRQALAVAEIPVLMFPTETKRPPGLTLINEFI